MAKVIKKAQDGFAANLLKKKAASDTTKMYDREEFINNINKRLKTPNAKSSSSKETISNFSDAEIKKAKAASKKKAQDGLRTGQYKRLGRIDEKNPARAERVADRMNTRATRVSRGKDIASPSFYRDNPMMNMKLSLDEFRFKKEKMKAGGMLKRADGSYSKRGLWDNIRANKGSGKKPTAAMLKQEKKIKAKTK